MIGLRSLEYILALLVVLMLATGVVLAQSGDSYDLTWNTVDGGGVTFSAGGGYTLGGTIGQVDAGMLQGGSFALGGGFWGGGGTMQYTIYLPLVMRTAP